MRLTLILREQHKGNQFILNWMVQARRKIREDGLKAALEERGIQVFDPNDVINPPFPKNRKDIPPPPPTLQETFTPPPPERHSKECYVFTHLFSPIMGHHQAQLLTNTLARHTLPHPITDHARTADNVTEVDERVKEAILHAHLLDTHQEKLPRILDVRNRPGWKFPREYGIPIGRKSKTLDYRLLLLLDQIEGMGVERQLLGDTKIQVMLEYGDRQMQFQHKAAYLVSSPSPLPPLASPEEVQEASHTEQLPDIYPVSQFSNCRPTHTYSKDEFYAVDTPHLHPHTIFIHHNQPIFKKTEDQFTGMSLLYAFSHAAAYAKLINKESIGDLDKPVTVQVVHIRSNYYHFGVFQLNTLNLVPSDTTTRNLFWTAPWVKMFDKCEFKAGKPILEGYNSEVFGLLRALHVQGKGDGLI